MAVILPEVQTGMYIMEAECSTEKEVTALASVYDANWAKATGRISWYCGMNYNLSGVGGRPNYRPNRAYVKRI